MDGAWRWGVTHKSILISPQGSGTPSHARGQTHTDNDPQVKHTQQTGQLAVYPGNLVFRDGSTDVIEL